MTTVEDARTGIMAAHASGESAQAQLSAAYTSLEDAANGLRHGTEGSKQPEADQAQAQRAAALEKVDEARWQVSAALAEFEGVASRL